MLTATLKFRTHAVAVTIHDDGHICCFKHTHNNSHCDYESFDDYSIAQEWIIEPFPMNRWVLEMHD